MNRVVPTDLYVEFKQDKFQTYENINNTQQVTSELETSTSTHTGTYKGLDNTSEGLSC